MLMSEMRGGRVIFGLVCLCGCVQSPLEGAVLSPAPIVDESPPVQQSSELAPPADSFWLAEAVSEMRKPPPVRARSISLGYVGDAPLVGGVMHDTPAPAGPADSMYPTQYAPPPPAPACSCALR